LQLLCVKTAPSPEAIDHMRRVAGFIRRHLDQGPHRNIAASALALFADELGP